MADYLRKVSNGESLSIPAKAYNTFIDTAKANRRGFFNSGTGKTQTALPPGQFMAYSFDLHNIQRFDCLGIWEANSRWPDSRLAWHEDDYEKVLMVGTVIHPQNIVIAQGPAESGISGIATPFLVQAYGITYAKIDIIDESHEYAIPQGYPARILKSATSGPARIIWKDSGLGEKLAVVWLGNQDFSLKISSNDTTARSLKEKLIGHEETDTVIPSVMQEVQDGGVEKLRPLIRREDVNAPFGINQGSLHRITVPAGTAAGEYVFDERDFRGRFLRSSYALIWANSEDDFQWATVSSETRFFGEDYAGVDRPLHAFIVSSYLRMYIKSGSGHLAWKWGANIYGVDSNAFGWVEATILKTTPDYVAT